MRLLKSSFIYRVLSVTLVSLSIAMYFILCPFYIKWIAWIVSAIFYKYMFSHYWMNRYLNELAGVKTSMLEISFPEVKKKLYENIFKGMMFSKVCSGLYGYSYIINCRNTGSIVNIDKVVTAMTKKRDYLKTMSLYQAGMYFSYNIILVLLYFAVLLNQPVTLMSVLNIACLFVPIGVAMRFGTLHCVIISDVYKSYKYIMSIKGGVRIR